MSSAKYKQRAKEIRIFIQTTSADDDPKKNSEYQENRIAEMIEKKFPSSETDKSSIDLQSNVKVFKHETFLNDEKGYYVEQSSLEDKIYRRRKTYHTVQNPYYTEEIFKCMSCGQDYKPIPEDELVKIPLSTIFNSYCVKCQCQL